MEKGSAWKWLVLVALVAVSLALLRNGVPLGLDLQGGTSFIVEIDEQQIREELKNSPDKLTPEEIERRFKEIREQAQERAVQVLRNRVDNLGIAEPLIFPAKDNRIIIQLPGIDQKKQEEAERNIKSAAFLEFRLVHDKNERLVRELEGKDPPEGYRVASFEDGIFFQRDDSYKQKAEDPGYRARLARHQVKDPDYEFMLESEIKDGRDVYRPWFIMRRREMTGTYLKKAAVDFEIAGPIVKLQFNTKGAHMFENITTDNVGRHLAIILDGTLYSAPVIREPIAGGHAQISGNFNLTEANRLRDILNAGSMLAPVKIIQRLRVSPSLGTDSIRSGVSATIYGAIGVVVFMILYYMLAGVVADLALVLNMLLLPLGMVVTAGFLGVLSGETGRNPTQLPVLTLPGIAGIALTLGMAVDANVLIFERIREEIGTGKRLWAAITAGYQRAFSAIVDSNLTTIFTGIILFFFGSGPIRGYAVTLCAGIIVSMYTAIVVTKMFFGVIASRDRVQTLKMNQFLGKTSIDFVEATRIALAVSLAVIVVTSSVTVARGLRKPESVFGVEFTGGTSLTFQFEKDLPIENIRRTLEAAGLRDVNIQYQGDISQPAVKTLLQIRTGADPIAGKSQGEMVKTALAEQHADSGFSCVQEESIGPQIGAELKGKAVWAMVFAWLGMIVYITIRFKLGFAVAGILALVHDVLVTAGVYSVCGRQFGVTVIAGLLTIIGYSINDTIVIFDRIRENLKLNRTATFREICNLSVNQTLSRTILTSVTVMIAVAMLLVFGGGAINDFAFTMFIGVITGTYSTVYIATPVVLLWYRNKRPDMVSK